MGSPGGRGNAAVHHPPGATGRIQVWRSHHGWGRGFWATRGSLRCHGPWRRRYRSQMAAGSSVFIAPGGPGPCQATAIARTTARRCSDPNGEAADQGSGDTPSVATRLDHSAGQRAPAGGRHGRRRAPTILPLPGLAGQSRPGETRLGPPTRRGLPRARLTVTDHLSLPSLPATGPWRPRSGCWTADTSAQDRRRGLRAVQRLVRVDAAPRACREAERGRHRWVKV